MFSLANITFFANNEYRNSSELIRAQWTSYIYKRHLEKDVDISIVKHYCNKEMKIISHPGFHFFHSRNLFGYVAMETIRFLKRKQPDIVLVEGLAFPLQILFLRLMLGSKVKIMARHRAGKPFRGIKKMLQQLADKTVSVYLFTSLGNADEWISGGIIRDPEKIATLPSTLTEFTRRDKIVSRKKLAMSDGLVYLWVGRLNANKDPLLVLDAFELYLAMEKEATLHLIFQTYDLLPEIEAKLAGNELLKQAVFLQGTILYDALPDWYSAADFFISASHSEAGSCAILEAMACGCIPIVTHIPSSMNMIADGRYGLSFEPGDSNGLFRQLMRSREWTAPNFSKKVEEHFISNHSAQAVAGRMRKICETLLTV